MPASGPQPRFSEIHEYIALELIREYESLGRKQLSDKLGVGEGSGRTILKRLKEKKLVTSTPQGHVLTQKGRRKLKRREKKFVQLPASNMTVGNVDIATIVEGGAKKVRDGIKQRDEAIKAGAEGATILVIKGSELQLADQSAEVSKKVAAKIKDYFHPQEGDAIVIGTGKNREEAERGALVAAKSLSS
ncbi:hypothetical protein AKJ43_00235 [candidate division MSBL1 archaeon SCGC-AAA261D19]|uniref:Uncharacterized protein n=1 Tax=candidate division MSBL1 archaeon SCGC-AAA261D19 TaxID=1698273 RepID=A0A133V8Q9_9EURY|nr:hypothetical protein AKJ43_00235 [candidate division MSBL1 archaeon SCGC-AAA261D19]